MAPKTNPDSFAAQLRKGIEEINENIDKKLDAYFKATEDRVSQAVKDLDKKFNELVSKIKQDHIVETNNMKSDIKHCYEFIKQIDKTTSNKFIELEKSHNQVIRRMNRNDVVVTGLPAASPNLKAMILKLSEVFNVPFSENDIQYTSMKNHSEVLIRFSLISTRDKLMKKYYITRKLMLKDLLEDTNEGFDLEERVYLSDHLTPLANKLCFMCRQLKRSKQISSFKFWNGNVPQAIIKLNSGAEETLDVFNIMEKYQDLRN